MASSSSSSSEYPYKYDVFLNFRGEDTRNTFVCHLYKALQKKGIKVFQDSENLRKGDNLSVLLQVIKESRLSIVVFSQKYVSSTWCLKELVQIVDCKDNQDQIVKPIFYGVDPTDLRRAVDFASECDADVQKVPSWRTAITKATNLVGWVSQQFKDDAILVEKIVEDVNQELNRIPSSKANDLVGIDSQIEKVERLLSLEKKDDVRKVGIWATGGLGTTTIVAAVYNKIYDQFDRCCFLKHVKKEFSRKDEEQMQVEFLSRILEEKVEYLNGDYERDQRIKDKLGNKRVLLVLDDVDKATQIDTLLGREPSLGGGSRIIVTARDKEILSGYPIYEPKPLSDEESLELLSQFAFNTINATREFGCLSRCFTECADGVRLALRVLGTSLDNESFSEGEDVLEKIKIIVESGIQNVLRTSFDRLNYYQKNIFLDIACFFRGMDRDCVTKVLDSCGFVPYTGLTVLHDRALITISNSNVLEMDDLLQDMGRKIVIGGCTNPGMRSRLWRYHDVVHVLTQNTAAEAVESLMVDLLNLEDICLKAEAFTSMTKLRLLSITYRQSYCPDNGKTHHLDGDLTFLSHELRYFVWDRCPIKSFPSNFDPKNLVHLDMRYSHIEELWQGIKSLKKLMSINLSYCRYLNNIPDLTGATNLEKLDLEGCTSLLKVHASIAGLTNLVFLSLKGCRELETLPCMTHMKSLQTLVLSGCLKLNEFPEISETMDALSVLNLDETAIEELPSSIERLPRLKSLSMNNCTSLVRLPNSICNLADLNYLNLGGCSKLDNLPENLKNLEYLWEIETQGSGIKNVPSSIVHIIFPNW
ncbi:hypothetical protein M0R45_009085 [Rubus argutus]|uniref:TIR domain-containing protein n=1 Tax=Rubus argutus TaxID=59490 RepID=A0AAW1Y2Z5_RUBAR